MAGLNTFLWQVAVRIERGEKKERSSIIAVVWTEGNASLHIGIRGRKY